jgi:hypothetical protein
MARPHYLTVTEHERWFGWFRQRMEGQPSDGTSKK